MASKKNKDILALLASVQDKPVALVAAISVVGFLAVMCALAVLGLALLVLTGNL